MKRVHHPELPIDEHFQSYTNNDRQQGSPLSMLENLLESGDFAKLVKTTLEDSRAFSVTLPESIQHANGFYKIILLNRAGYQLRLHVWHRSIQYKLDENPHNHRWNFATRVLCGRYTETTFEEAEGDDYDCLSYTKQTHATTYQLSPIRRTSLRPTKVTTATEGSGYWLHKDSIHKVHRCDPSHTTATALIVEPTARHYSHVYVSRDPSRRAAADTPYRPLTESQLRWALKLGLRITG